jgi:hypothetical protein
MYTHCLDALHSYIIGPAYGLHAGILLGDTWDPKKCFTKRVVESERLPATLSSILDHNVVVNSSNQGLLRSAIRCIRAIAEGHAGCLEGMLRLGFRHKIIALLQQRGVEISLLRTALSAVAVLCGHTHSFPSDGPTALKFTPKELFDILFTQSKVLSVIMTRSFDEVDEFVIVNAFTILKYTLPLLSSVDPLFQVHNYLNAFFFILVIYIRAVFVYLFRLSWVNSFISCRRRGTHLASYRVSLLLH